MRARLNRDQDQRWRLARLRRDDHPAARAEPAHATDFDLGPVEPAEPAAAAPPVIQDVRDLSAERRLRASGGPTDRANYSCECGYVFEARVSTSVRCPHCGTGQAW
jgi:hypothetical protein